MSQVQVFPLIDGFIGYGDGASVQVETGTPIDADHQVVKERPELFTTPPAEGPKRSAPAQPKPSKPRSSNG